MEDGELLTAFVEGTSQAASGPALTVDGATPKVDGWWPMAYQISPAADRSAVDPFGITHLCGGPVVTSRRFTRRR